ncbi:MAG: DEAD/DEAH box helicase [Candidatus Rokubacteria bacterium]|nr:DEAD/DEAH box helicase [Candidatus Rokubacteria bacterium]MBI3824433.1 DEAD/DEAH box helicase [Candidatus Rokubacteria bacterium]
MPEFLPFVRRWFDATFGVPTRPQREGWEAIASGHDTLVVAPTGSGKTLAAFLWALDHLHRLAMEQRLDDRVHVVYVSPLRALNNDIEKNLRAPLAGIRAAAEADGLLLPEIRVAVRTGDTLPPARQAMVRRPPHILITTPESLYILLTSQRFRPALATARFVIVDEVHALMGNKRGAHLALSLERLQALTAEQGGPRPQRIGCSATVSPLETALDFLTGTTASERTVVDAGFSRDLDVQVVSPVDDFLTHTSDTIWESALQQIAEMVEGHRTTLVFAQSRRAAERLARDLDDRIGGGRVAAHHGSLSRRARLDAESRLKAGELKALVCTSSLELGIDVGAIDLVVQVQSPRTVAAALQRVGRAGHLLSRVSKGRIVVTKGEELVEAAAVVRSIRALALDSVAMPECPLDVLAQQVVAAVAAESLTVDALWERVRTAAPYRTLARETLCAVLRCLAEPLPLEVKGIGPRILWDRVNDRVHARRGTRFLALTSGGTIPDAGLYDVYVAETDLKVGTLDEEFVTESLPGDVFLLGSHAWKMTKVRADRVLVEDAQGMSPTIPFWKGEHPSRSYELGAAVGRLRRETAERLDDPGFEAWAGAECGLDARAAAAMRAWLGKAAEVLDGVPDDQGLVVESFADEMGGRHAMIHSVFGMRINGAWGMALREKVRRAFGLVVEASHVDDGILLSFAPGQVPPAPARLATLVAPEEVDALLGRALIGSPLFTTRFRHAAVRALFVPRMMHGQRTPAYVQRLRADALMESVGGQADFPVVSEALRECFHDALDVPRLKRLLERIHDGEMWTRHVDAPLPSPFVYPLLAAWDWAYLDAGHAEERRSDTVSVRKAWSVAPGPLQPDVVAAVEAELQHTAGDRRARDANEFAAILDELGDLTEAEIAERCLSGSGDFVAALRAENRVVPVEFEGSGRRAWIAAMDVPLYRALRSDDGLERVALRLLRTRGPVSAGWLGERYGVLPADAERVLDTLAGRGIIRRGDYLAGAPAPGVARAPAPQYVHVAVLDEVQRRQVHARRVPRPVVTPEQFQAFLLRRHHLHPEHRRVGPPGVLASLEMLQGVDVPVRVWEQDLLAARVDAYEREWLDRLGLAGEIVWTVFAPRDAEDPARGARVGVALRENVAWLRAVPAEAPEIDARTKNVLLHLQLRGASFAQDIARLAGLTTDETLAALWALFWLGLVAPDTFSAIVASTTPRAAAAIAAPGRRRRGQVRGVLARAPVVGRWSAVADDERLSPEERDEARARLLLARYGVLARDLAPREWGALRHALLRMEYGGEVVRGYFVQGLAGEQYGLAAALDDLLAAPRRAEPHVLVNLTDPANLWGKVFALARLDGTHAVVARLAHAWLIFRAGRPVLLAGGYGRDLTPLAGWEPADLPGAIRSLQAMLDRPPALRPVRRLEVETWDGRPAHEGDAGRALIAAGFAQHEATLYWEGNPSTHRRM